MPVSLRDPIKAILDTDAPAALAVITNVAGPFYRPIGTMMAILGEQERVGSLSSGCVESDIALRAQQAREAGKPAVLLYGAGSPFMDIRLPCGGGMEVLILPDPDREVLRHVITNQQSRKPCALKFGTEDGAMEVLEHQPTARSTGALTVQLDPELRFLVLGSGPEATSFGALVQSADYENLVISTDPETLARATEAGCSTREIVSPHLPADIDVDDRTAVVLFFHDHEWEPGILASALKTPAFYIGAQGSQRALQTRLEALSAMGLEADELGRLHGPIGLIPSARDPRTLAISVLGEIVEKAIA
ncbi:MAG: XdhC family protein [Rhodobacteraceae bacterium]|nr:XdhC family protein [Paracoccaceae bacterium]